MKVRIFMLFLYVLCNLYVGRVARAGRTGTAYSIVCPDELPFVIDLHLFLGRPLSFVQPNEKYQGMHQYCKFQKQLVIL